MYKFMDQETAMKKALKTERQEGWQEGRKDGQQEIIDLINYLWNHGRREDALRALNDRSFLDRLFLELRKEKIETV